VTKTHVALTAALGAYWQDPHHHPYPHLAEDSSIKGSSAGAEGEDSELVSSRHKVEYTHTHTRTYTLCMHICPLYIYIHTRIYTVYI